MDIIKELYSIYQEIEANVDIVDFLDKVTYFSPVNFNDAKKFSRHRWYPYKEGFSPKFVREFLEKCKKGNDYYLLDPFAGVGTTVVEGAKCSFRTIGFEVNPLAFFVAKTKYINLSQIELQELEKVIDKFAKSSLNLVDSPPDNETVNSYFEDDYLEALLAVKYFYKEELGGNLQDLFKLAFLTSIDFFSTHRKAGNGVKKKTRLNYTPLLGNPIQQVKDFILGKLEIFIKDLKKPIDNRHILLINDSCLVENNYPDVKVDCVLTSPPYANCFDYSKIYLSELWFGDFFQRPDSQKEFRLKSVRSHVHSTWPERYDEFGSDIITNYVLGHLVQQKLWSKKIPHMLKGYFDDMGHLLKILSQITIPGSTLGFVVGNSVYGGISIATDLILVDLAAKFGFKPTKIEIYRRIVPSSQQYKLIKDGKYLRESLVILNKI